jgi:hypothetical protein
MSQCHDTYDPIEGPTVRPAPSTATPVDGAQCHDTYEDKEPASAPESAAPAKTA